MKKNSWWQTDEYTEDQLVPDQFLGPGLWGPKGQAFVRVFPNGKTDKGWGLVERRANGTLGAGFMKRYLRGDFMLVTPIHTGYKNGAHGLAYVMRSASILAIDIDGKNGGFEHTSELGFLPRTLAEKSKSGNGYHLFYLVDDEWDAEVGFGRFGDIISIVQGVDIRYTGCIFHYPQQLWNNTDLAPLPQHLIDRFEERTIRKNRVSVEIRKTMESEDIDMQVMLQDELKDELAKPIQEGRRNTTLFAIGTKMMQAQVPGWEDLLLDRASQLGLDDEEADKIVENVTRYQS